MLVTISSPGCSGRTAEAAADDTISRDEILALQSSPKASTSSRYTASAASSLVGLICLHLPLLELGQIRTGQLTGRDTADQAATELLSRHTRTDT